jgi:hypothetical protein
MEEQLRYPIGRFKMPDDLSEAKLKECIHDIEIFPDRIKSITSNLTDLQLDTPYRPGGWTIRQLVHHCADSHMNSLVRFKLALTEKNPVIKPYFEDRWATLADSKNMSLEASLLMLEGIHLRWTYLLKTLTKDQLGSTFFHTAQWKKYRLDEAICLYAWHCRHHLAHIEQAIK